MHAARKCGGVLWLRRAQRQTVELAARWVPRINRGMTAGGLVVAVVCQMGTDPA
jgi:hypothetical protein